MLELSESRSMMQAGKLDQRITLQTSAISKDAVGGPVDTWSDLATVWANVYDLSGKALNEAQQVGSSVTRRVTVRRRSGLTSGLRVRFASGRLAKVSFVRELGRDFTELHCEDLDG
jgi:SPP1 family predicted phage head-tail adaptor